MPLALLLTIAAVFGLIIGSFLNVVVLRDGRRKTIMTGRSECMHCGHVLSWYELIPIVSFLIQGGRCRACKKGLSLQYPIGEILSAGIAMFSVWYGYVERGSLLLAVGIFLSLSLLLVISQTDIRTMEIRPEYAIASALLGGIAQGLSGNIAWIDILYGILLGGGSIFILAYGWKLLTGKQGMGDGDIWIAAAVGALVGYPNLIIALFVAVGVGAVIGLILTAVSKKGLNAEMPFGPFLALGGVAALVWGQSLISWYIL